jgi:AraC-like DNA-binding protein
MTEPLSNDQIFISKLTEVVLENLKNEKFGVKELVRELNMSHYGLSRKLYLINGKKVNPFIHEIRMKKALELLQSEDTTAAEVSYNVGFSSPSYFNKCFHEYFGYPPGKVIRKEGIVWDDKTTGEKIEESWPRDTRFKRHLYTFPGILITTIILIIIGFLLLKKIQRSEPNLQDKRIVIAVLPF